MVLEAAPIEDDFFDIFAGCAFRDKFANHLCTGNISAHFGSGPEASLCGVDRNKGVPGRVVNKLGRNVTSGKMNAETRTFGCPGKLLAQAGMTEFSFICCRHGLLDGFAFFAADLFPNETDTFAFIWLRRVKGAYVGSALSDHMLVNSFN